MPIIVSITAFAQIDAGLFRYPDVSATNIVFTYANDLWTIPKTGGAATKLSSPAGVEVFPKFSPDGKDCLFRKLRWQCGCICDPHHRWWPIRLTSHGYPDRVVDWTLDGESIICSSRESGKQDLTSSYCICIRWTWKSATGLC